MIYLNNRKIEEVKIGNVGLNWSLIGYSKKPELLANGYNYAKQIYDGWDSTITDLTFKFEDDSNLLIFPLVDTSKVTNMSAMFVRCTKLIKLPPINTSLVNNMQAMFNGCTSLESVELDTSNVTNMSQMFKDCTSLVSISLNVANVTNMGNMFDNCINLRKVNLIGLGTKQEVTEVDFSYLNANKLLGIDGNGVAGCKQALLDTLLTNSFDRATAGYPICTIRLVGESKAVLSKEEISAIEAKGYKIE